MRAVHLELASSLSADSTIMAFCRMIARRGMPSEIYSDNGTNSRGTSEELKKAYSELTQSPLKEYAITKRVK